MRRLLKYITYILVLIMITCSCTKKDNHYINQLYVLESATYEGEVDKDFKNYRLELKDDGTLTVFIQYLTNISNRTGTYTNDLKTIVETSNGKTYTYTFIDDKLKIEYFDGSVTFEIMLKEYVDPSTIKTEVDFESVLFGDSIDEVKIFNYCPAIIKEVKDGKELMHVWYCTNRIDGVIMDHVGYRVGEKQANGKWIFSNQEIVLAPTTGTWDGRHTCDPAVIRGEFHYQSEDYHYMMAYLGCVTEDYQKNETGIAVAKEISGPWVKVDTLNPIVPWYDDGDYETEQQKYESYKGTDRIYWGTGMPALINLDGRGDVLMFYQSTYRGTGIQRWDFSNLDNPIKKFTSSISSKGAINPNGTASRVGIPDFMLDLEGQRLYVASVTNLKNPADVTLTRVNSHSWVGYLEGIDSVETLCTILERGVYTWKVLGYVGPDETGYARNHNPGLVRNEYGHMAYSDKVDVIVSTGTHDRAYENIFTYRLFGHSFKL